MISEEDSLLGYVNEMEKYVKGRSYYSTLHRYWQNAVNRLPKQQEAKDDKGANAKNKNTWRSLIYWQEFVLDKQILCWLSLMWRVFCLTLMPSSFSSGHGSSEKRRRFGTSPTQASEERSTGKRGSNRVQALRALVMKMPRKIEVYH